MLKKSRKVLAVVCCLMFTFTNIAFGETEKNAGVNMESILEEIPKSAVLSGYTYKYENAPNEIKEIYAAKCAALNIIPQADDEIFVPERANFMSEGDTPGVYTNYYVDYNPSKKTIKISGGANYTISTTKLVGYGHNTRGTEVNCAQVLLGLLNYNVLVDSIFGNDTYNAVVSFQRKYSLSADGVVGSATWDKLGRLTDPSFS
ncbi:MULTISPECIES: peptidoglycan-binding protein [unclassified Clostridioides]|uniref:peptidoglycan-binding domain-containing protein n=1 Tax=unclassified Clostridioides TaxID=2635829 RepID=UPI001D0FD6FE|nr:peptidoglycan-binding protein [Clostridioides sp. ZZV14-6045]MCC0731622.1 peptidoglycan-binding protein [Clostridioides sp. ZZV14-6048]MCC0733319.1 peptidoglycan-binding protein [Clostridioides sp. ZZV14-6009]MCC0737147.1 peptidoglycan-binding protein [Clostridioides sp. ZZV14-5902]